MKHLAIAAALIVASIGVAEAGQYQYQHGYNKGYTGFDLGADSTAGATTSGASGAALAGYGKFSTDTQSGAMSSSYGNAKLSGSCKCKPTIKTDAGNISEGFSGTNAKGYGYGGTMAGSTYNAGGIGNAGGSAWGKTKFGNKWGSKGFGY